MDTSKKGAPDVDRRMLVDAQIAVAAEAPQGCGVRLYLGGRFHQDGSLGSSSPFEARQTFAISHELLRRSLALASLVPGRCSSLRHPHALSRKRAVKRHLPALDDRGHGSAPRPACSSSHCSSARTLAVHSAMQVSAAP